MAQLAKSADAIDVRRGIEISLTGLNGLYRRQNVGHRAAYVKSRLPALD